MKPIIPCGARKSEPVDPVLCQFDPVQNPIIFL
jgi:hypothetical protein